jgi:DNA repair protein RecO (recombination protein O)
LRRGELGRLTQVEGDGLALPLEGQRLLGGFYANELLLRLLARGDPNPDVFSCYSRCLSQLAGTAGLARSLRIFEYELLAALGYGLELGSEATNGEPVSAEAFYVFEVEQGLRRSAPGSPDEDVYPGRDLLSLTALALADDGSLRTAQRLLGRVLKTHLGDRPLKTRMVLQDIVSRGL